MAGGEQRPGGLRLVMAVVSGLFGLRRRADFEKDAAALTLKQVIVGAVVLMAVFVATIVFVVHMIIG